MTVESSVQVAPDSTGKKIDTVEVTTSAGLVERQVTAVGDPADPSAKAAVRLDGQNLSTDYSIATHVRQLLGQAIAIGQPLRSIARALATAPDPATGRIRILLDAISASLTLATVTTVTTCATVTNASQLGGVDAKLSLLYSNERMNWAENVRARIS